MYVMFVVWVLVRLVGFLDDDFFIFLNEIVVKVLWEMLILKLVEMLSNEFFRDLFCNFNFNVEFL